MLSSALSRSFPGCVVYIVGDAARIIKREWRLNFRSGGRIQNNEGGALS